MCVALGLVGLVGQARAQGRADDARADIEYGLTVYRAQCATCHLDTGDGVPGVDLRSGHLRRAANDRELQALITAGIPGTGMPPADLDTAELAGIIAYLRNMNFEADAVPAGKIHGATRTCAPSARVRGGGGSAPL